MIFDETYSQYIQLQDKIKNQLNELLERISGGKIPGAEITDLIWKDIEKLRNTYYELKEYAVSVADQNDILDPDASILEFKTIVENSWLLQMERKLEEIELLFTEFMSVCSDHKDYSDALQHYQQEAEIELDMINTSESISENAENLSRVYKPFLDLIKNTDVNSQSWKKIHEDLDDTEFFSRKVMRGLSYQVYYIPEKLSEKDVSAIQKFQENCTQEIPTEEQVNNEQKSNETVYVSPRQPMKLKNPSVGKFSKLLDDDKFSFQAGILLPILYHFGPVSKDTAEVAWQVIPTQSPVVKFMKKYESKGSNKRTPVVIDSESDTFDEYISPTLNYLEKNNVISIYCDPGEKASPIICLTPYGYECMGKETIRNKKYMDRGPFHNTSYWVDFYKCSRKFTAKERLSWNELYASSYSNFFLFYYIQLVDQQLEHSEQIIKFLRQIEWDGEHYKVDLFHESDVVPCMMFDKDENFSDFQTGKIIVTDRFDSVNPTEPDIKFPLFLFSPYDKIISVWNENGWKIVYAYSSDKNEDTDKKDQGIVSETDPESPIDITNESGPKETIESTADEKNDEVDIHGSEEVLTEDQITDDPSIREDEIAESAQEIIIEEKEFEPLTLPDIEFEEQKILCSLLDNIPEIRNDLDPDDMTAHQLAAYLYINNYNPTLNANVALFSRLVYQLLKENRIAEAVTLARSLALIENQPDYKDLCVLLLSAANICDDDFQYTGEKIQELYGIFENRSGTDEDYFLLLTAILRGLFHNDNENSGTDYQLINLVSQIYKRDHNPDKQLSSNIQGLLNCFAEMNKIIPSGFSDDILDIFRKTNSKQKKEDALASEAQQLMNPPANTVNVKALSEFNRDYFGQKSELYKLLSYVSNKDKGKTEEIYLYLEEYKADYKDYSDDHLGDYIQDLWRKYAGGPTTLKHGGRTNTIRNFRDRFMVLDKWVLLMGIDRKSISDDKKGIAQKARNEALKFLSIIRKELQNKSRLKWATIPVLTRMLNNIESTLQIETIVQDEQSPYQCFYQTHYILLNNNGYPIIDRRFQNVYYAEPWRQMLRHLLAEKISIAEALDHIQNDEKQSFWRDNFGLAKLISKDLKLDQSLEYDRNNEEHKYFTVHFQEHFVKDLELAAFYGQLPENLKDELMEDEKALRHFFKDSDNYGQYLYMLFCLKKRIDEESISKKIEKYKSINDLPNEIKYGRSKDVEKIRNLVDSGKFMAADDKLNRLKKNEGNLWLVEEEKSFLEHFLGVYGSIYSSLKDYKGKEVPSFYKKILENFKQWEMVISDAYRQKVKSRKSIFPNWGKEKDADAIKDILSEFDFDVESVKAEKNSFTAKVIPPRKNLPQYIHPIDRFGTHMDSSLKIVYLKGNITVSRILKESRNYAVSGTGVIFLVDHALSIEDRRDLIDSFMFEPKKDYPFIVIDRVLLFYLAAQERANRMKVLLECTLPFSYTQPYSAGKGPVSDEMFFGRSDELTNIRLGRPSCLVYGGRQLGKTVLMRRAESLDDKPEEKQYAVYIDAKGYDVNETVKFIGETLHRLSIIPNKPKTIEELCNSIDKMFKEEWIKRLLLLIDEADEYLENDSKSDYRATKRFRDLSNDRGGNFKFVFAGLHNVARTAAGSEKNSLIQQFKMVPIGQLSKGDAEQLIQKPMRYLGFRLEPEQIASIIENTNYFPGVLQYFCHEMIEEIYGNFRSHYRTSASDWPPYKIQDHNLKSIITKARLNDEIKERLLATLKLDPRYMFFANLIAYLSYADRMNGVLNSGGYSLKEIKNDGSVFAPNLTNYDYEQILPEMVVMGILSFENGKYKLQRTCFLEMIGDSDSVDEYLESEPLSDKDGDHE